MCICQCICGASCLPPLCSHTAQVIERSPILLNNALSVPKHSRAATFSDPASAAMLGVLEHLVGAAAQGHETCNPKTRMLCSQ